MIKIKHFIVLIPLLLLMGCNHGYSVDPYGEVSEQIIEWVTEELKTSNERIAFNRIELDVKKAGKKVLFYGIKNNLSAETTFNIDVSCNKDLFSEPGTDYVQPMKFENDKQRAINAGDIDVLKMNILMSSEATPNTHVCYMVVTNGDNEYATKEFFITVPDR